MFMQAAYPLYAGDIIRVCLLSKPGGLTSTERNTHTKTFKDFRGTTGSCYTLIRPLQRPRQAEKPLGQLLSVSRGLQNYFWGRTGATLYVEMLLLLLLAQRTDRLLSADHKHIHPLGSNSPK